jgi:hypothetical protein
MLYLLYSLIHRIVKSFVLRFGRAHLEWSAMFGNLRVVETSHVKFVEKRNLLVLSTSKYEFRFYADGCIAVISQYTGEILWDND